jgi:lysozyme
MRVSQKCKEQMIHHEGLKLRPYLCPAHIYTIGIGSVLYQDQIKLPMMRSEKYTGMIRKEYPLAPEHNRVWTRDEVLALFDRDLATFERGVLRLCPQNLTQGRFDALVSFSFNVGLGNLQKSTIRMKHNRGDFEGAAKSFMDWTKAAGKVLPGLVKRRKDEVSLYSTQESDSSAQE